MKRPVNQDNYPKSNVSTLDQTETQCPVRYVCSAFQDFLIQFLKLRHYCLNYKHATRMVFEL